VNTKHTPGPWRTLAKNPRKIVTAETRHTIVASCYTDASNGPGLRTKQSAGSPPREDAEANARLIAAAPELLAALEDCIAVMTNELRGLSVIQPELAAARAAIAKVIGKEPA
jgi:hypothetical protein